MNINQALPPNPYDNSQANIASAAPPHPPIPKRRHSQRIYLKDRPESIYQLQLSEIQMLNQQLKNYKRQIIYYDSTQPTPSIPHALRYQVHSRESQKQAQQHRAHPENFSTIVRVGEHYRDELLAASELRNEEQKQKFNILRHIEALARERQSLLSQIANQKAKTSLLQQELFLAKDSSTKFLIKAEAERNELLGQIKGLQMSCGKLEGALNEVNSQVAVIPLYEQRYLQKEGTIALLTQELSQVRTEIGYFMEKSKYFQNNHTVLNENFNNLYMTNLSLSSEIKEMQRRHTLAEEQLKQANKKVILLKQEKEKSLNELSFNLRKLIMKNIGNIQSSPSEQKPEEKLALSFQQLKNSIKLEQGLILNLKKQIGNKENIILLQKSISGRLVVNLKDQQEDWKKKEEHWREATAKEIANINRDFTAKILELEAKNIVTKDEAAKMEKNLKSLEEVVRSAQKKQLQLSNRIQAHLKQFEAKEEVIKALKSELEQIKHVENLRKNSINDYQRRLNTSMTVQQQLLLNTRANLQEKHSKIKELQEKLSSSREELIGFQIRFRSLEDELVRSRQDNDGLRSDLTSLYSAKERLEVAFVNQSEELGRIQEQAALKEKIIDKYYSLTDEMTEKIIRSEGEAEQLRLKYSKLLEQATKEKAKNEKLQSTYMQVSASSQNKQHQNVSLQQKVITLEKALKQITAKNLEIDTLVQNLKHRLREKERQVLTAEMALKQAIKNLTLERDELTARIIKQNGQKIEALTSEWAVLEDNYKKVIAHNKSSLEEFSNSLDILTSQKSEGELKIAKLTKIINQKEISIVQHAQNLAKTYQQLNEARQKSKQLFEELLRQKQQLSQALRQAQTQCQGHKIQKVKQTLLFADSETKREDQLKNSKQTLTEIAQLLSNERAKGQTLELQKNLLKKSLKQMQQVLTSQLQVELAQKSQAHRQQILRKQQQITLLTTQRSSLRNALESQRLKLEEKESIISKLQAIIHRNNQVYKSEAQFLKKANLQLQADCSRLLQSSQAQSQIAATTSRLEMKNSFLEQTLARTLNEVESMQPLFGEVKQERDQLIKKYIILSNQISSIKSQKEGLDNELDAFSQYFSKISALYTQIGRHFYNISHISQGTSFRVVHSVLPMLEQSQLAK